MSQRKRANGEWRRFCLTIAYDGSGYSGWQSQPGGNTIQDTLDWAIGRICAEALGVQGSGRTDAGVHALGQVAHFDAPAALSMDAAAWLRGLNSFLPPTIRVLECRPADSGFHSRFSAQGKVYRYEWYTGPILHPLRVGRTWHVRRCPDEELIHRVAALFVGTHDFAGFAANRGEPEEARGGTVRTIQRVAVTRSGDEWTATFAGDGFLYKMVRLLVGGMVRCGQGACSFEGLRERLEHPARAGKSPLAAPAAGLYLVEVHYPPSGFNPRTEAPL